MAVRWLGKQAKSHFVERDGKSPLFSFRAERGICWDAP